MPEYLKKINRSSVVQRVIDRLTQAMLSGELKPGDKIPDRNGAVRAARSGTQFHT